MRVLIGSYYLGGLTGSETFWYTVADHLVRKGAEVHCYAAEWGDRVGKLMELGCRVEVGLPYAGSEEPDICLVSHVQLAEFVSSSYPGVPVFYFCHGILPKMERPPERFYPEGWYAVSLEAAAFVQAWAGCDWSDIVWPFNPVDGERFRSVELPARKFQDVLVVSNRMPASQRKTIEKAVKELGWWVRFVGVGWEMLDQDRVAELMGSSRIVVSLGRGVIEAMMAEAVPVIFDYKGGDGVVSPGNVEKLARRNFSGRTGQLAVTYENVWEAFCAVNNYWGPRLRAWALERYGAKKLVDELWERMQREVG